MHDISGVLTCISVKNANLDTDSFEMSTLPAERSWIRSKDNKFVFINFEEKKFEAQTMNAVQRRKPGKMH